MLVVLELALARACVVCVCVVERGAAGMLENACTVLRGRKPAIALRLPPAQQTGQPAHLLRRDVVVVPAPCSQAAGVVSKAGMRPFPRAPRRFQPARLVPFDTPQRPGRHTLPHPQRPSPARTGSEWCLAGAAVGA